MDGARRGAKFAIGAVLVAVVVILIANSNDGELIIFGSQPSYPHYLNVTVPSAFEAATGQRVTEGGEGVGTIVEANVTKDAQAHLRLGLSSQAWPLPANSTFTLRMGGTIKYTDRFISIAKGDSTDYFADNDQIPAKQFTVPVEYNQLFDVFNASTRQGLKSFFGNTSKLAPAATPFRHAIQPPTAAAVGEAADVFNDLSSENQSLSTLISSTAEITGAIQQANPGVQTLVQSGSNTFATIAGQSASLKRILDTAAPGLHAVGFGLLHTGRTLPHVEVLARKLAPGVTQLDDLAKPLDSTLNEIVNVEPTAVSTLSTVTTQGPNIDKLLSTARTELLPQLANISNQAVPMLDCLRPYSPEAMSFLQGWGGFLTDGYKNPPVHVLHAVADFLPFPSEMPIDTTQMHQLFPELGINYPAPPGTWWDDPWYQPQCDITAADLNPANDPEAHTLDPLSNPDIPYGPVKTPNYGPTNIP